MPKFHLKCQEQCMQQAKCYSYNEPSVMTHKEYKQQAKYQEEYMRQVKCYPCNKPNIMTHEECIKTSQVLRGIHGASKVLHMQKTKGHDL